MMTRACSEESTQAGHAVLRVRTRRFGEIEVNPERVITMTSPILGFPESRRYILRPHGADSPFLWLQSLDNPDLAFVVVQSALIDVAYAPRLAELDREELALASGQDAELLIILTLLPNAHPPMTANLLGPVALNPERRLAKQLLLDPAVYDIALPLE